MSVCLPTSVMFHYFVLHMQSKFNISDGIDGSAISYNISYTGVGSNSICASVIVLAEMCTSGVCEHELEFSGSYCDLSIESYMVVVTGTNTLGKGQPSTPISIHSKKCMFSPIYLLLCILICLQHMSSMINQVKLTFTDMSNHFVDVSFDPVSKTFTCFYINQQKSSNKLCSIEFGLPSESCKSISILSNTMSLDSLRIGLPVDYQFLPRTNYCFNIKASNGTYTAIVKGSGVISTPGILYNVMTKRVDKPYYGSNILLIDININS